MDTVSVRDLRNYGGQILDQIEGGESMTITRDGVPVAMLSPLPRPQLSAAALIKQWRTVPVIDGDQLREDIARILDLDL